ncbi:class I SAM-dependent methyltransferase [Silanimonas sp.]|uniref:class I SAM-dependent DNA methyltransferase n=1 Tax=Silanimonas sp. TaxID=1929290 RepID=UPI0022CABF07|nr:class I SAM-dependent methyltransferase [Silanimonas sp.]MCZ8114006.1 class I SAM-dependent methyltransferase [Silanimonas sp.]
MKTYDRAYFDRWYRQADGSKASRSRLDRTVALALASAEAFLGRRVRTVLDVGCGEGHWRAPLLAMRPGVQYLGLDASEYAVQRFGRTRNLHWARFGDLASLRPCPPVDLLVCADVLHYVPDAELRAGLPGVAELCGGVAFIETYTAEDIAGDDVQGDFDAFIARPAKAYRRALARVGFTFLGQHCWLSPALSGQATALERA